MNARVDFERDAVPDHIRADGFSYAAAHKHLYEQMMWALLNDPSRGVECPGFEPSIQSAELLVYDALSDAKTGDLLMHELLQVLGKSASGKETQLHAAVLARRIAKQHADYHADDLVTKWNE